MNSEFSISNMIELGWVAPGDGGQALALLPLSLYDL